MVTASATLLICIMSVRLHEVLRDCTTCNPWALLHQPARPGQLCGARAVSNKEELFEFLVESSVDFAIFTIDPNGLTTSWNVGAERLFGYSEEQILGRPADVVLTAEDRAAAAPEKERSEASIHGRAADERWHQRKNGSRFWASGLLMPLRNEGAGFVRANSEMGRGSFSFGHRARAGRLLRPPVALRRLYQAG
jgi:PAS domain S-box-containing protein